MILFDNATETEQSTLSVVINYALEVLEQPKNVQISLSFVSADEIRQLNRDYRETDEVTDVLSFPMLDIVAGDVIDDRFREDFDLDTDSYILGDVVICREQVEKQAKESGKSAIFETCYLALHSLLHLLGYDHTTAQEEQTMFTLQDKIIGECKIS